MNEELRSLIENYMVARTVLTDRVCGWTAAAEAEIGAGLKQINEIKARRRNLENVTYILRRALEAMDNNKPEFEYHFDSDVNAEAVVAIIEGYGFKVYYSRHERKATVYLLGRREE